MFVFWNQFWFALMAMLPKDLRDDGIVLILIGSPDHLTDDSIDRFIYYYIFCYIDARVEYGRIMEIHSCTDGKQFIAHKDDYKDASMPTIIDS